MAKTPSVTVAILALLLGSLLTAIAGADEPRVGGKLRSESSRPLQRVNTASVSGVNGHHRRGTQATASSTTDKKVRPSKQSADEPVSAVTDGGVAGLVNNSCANALPISGAGPFNFNSVGLSTDGPAHAACSFNGQTQIDNDEWFCWTAPAAPCGGEFVLSTCGSAVDTKVAIYTGCGCPATDARLIECSDDDCGVQTMIPFNPVPGQQYLIRVGIFPTSAPGSGTFGITCHANHLPCDQSSDNCQVASQDDAVNSNGSDFIVADDFTPTASGNITNLCFWGGYLADVGQTNCAGVAPDNLVVRYYSSVNGRPGMLLATYSQAGGTLSVTGPEPTGLTISNSVPEYEYSATHAPLPVSAGTCYWVEISNAINGCSWFWELSNVENNRAFQDGRSGSGPNGYTPEETLVADLALCVGQPLGDPVTCYPPVPANNDCANAQAISTAADIPYDLSSATQDGPAYNECLFSNQAQIAHDIWYCWTAPCTSTAFVRTCGDTTVDTKIAVYNGCTCPPAEADVVACNDDRCGDDGFQSMATFDVVEGQSYLIRLGTYPGAPGGGGILHISCGPPDNPACPGTGSCCDAQTGGGCGNETCCETVCACDPFCCETEWDTGCSTNGFADSGCGADSLCGCGATCGSPKAGDCCSGHDTPACDDAECCQAVCECDTFCCETEWDAFCAGNGSIPNCGAAVLCTEHCAANCPVPPPGSPIQWLNPPENVVDARRPTNLENPPVREGISQIVVLGPPGADTGCWSFCETGVVGQSNFIANVTEVPSQMQGAPSEYTITLDRPITPGFVTRITYTDNNSTATSARFYFHPANVNSDGFSNSGDLTALVISLQTGTSLPWAKFSGDADRSNFVTPLDILTVADLLNGADAFGIWKNYAKPVAAPVCP